MWTRQYKLTEKQRAQIKVDRKNLCWKVNGKSFEGITQAEEYASTLFVEEEPLRLRDGRRAWHI